MPLRRNGKPIFKRSRLSDYLRIDLPNSFRRSSNVIIIYKRIGYDQGPHGALENAIQQEARCGAMNWMPREALRIEQPSLRQNREAVAFNTLLVLWRRRWLLLGFVLVGLTVAVLALMKMEREYQSSAVIRLEFGADLPLLTTRQSSGSTVDAIAIVESEARVIRSDAMARRVISRLNLENDPAFVPKQGLMSRLLSTLALAFPSEPLPLSDQIATRLLNGLSISNDSRSYLISITYTDGTPEVASAIANAFADEYLQSRIEANQETAQQTSAWLAGQIQEKRAALALSEKALLAEANQIDIRAREARQASLQAQVNTIRERLRILAESYENVRLLLDLKPAAARVVIQARPANFPAGPKPVIVLGIALGAALGFGIGLALLLERRDTGFRTDLEVSSTVDTPCLGSVPEIAKNAPVANRLAASVAVQEAATSAGFDSSSPFSKVAIIGSALPGEGKAFFIEELTQSLLTSGRRVLIIDASPRAARNMAEPMQALEPLLASAEARAVFFAEHQVSTCAVVCRASGLADSQEAFLASSFEEFLQQARSHFDRILIKSPPVLLLAESWLLSAHVDAFILVTRWNKTPRAVVRAALRRLSQRSVRVAGIVLSRVVPNLHKKYLFADQIYFMRKYNKFYRSAT
jgi:Mrp family chromosome partitioning ATPase